MKRTFSVAPGQSVNEALGFIALSVEVDNQGGQWVNVPDANLQVAPYTVGVVAPLIGATQTARINTVPPPDQSNFGGGAAAQVTFSSDAAVTVAGSSTLGLPGGASHCESVAGGGAVVVPLDFTALRVTVNNNGGQWVNVPAAHLVVPPWTIGVSASIQAGTTLALASTTPPAGQINPGGGDAALICWYAAPGAVAAGNSSQGSAGSVYSATLGGGSGNTTVNHALGFTAYAVQIDNPGGQWVNVAGQAIAPYTLGAVIALTTPTSTAMANITPPSGQANTLTGDAATLTWTAQPQAAATGVAYAQNLASGSPSFSYYLAEARSPNTPDWFAFGPIIPAGNYDLLAVHLSVGTAVSVTAGGTPYMGEMDLGLPAGVFAVLYRFAGLTVATPGSAQSDHFVTLPTPFRFAADGINHRLRARATILDTAPPTPVSWSANTYNMVGGMYLRTVVLATCCQSAVLVVSCVRLTRGQFGHHVSPSAR